MPGIFTLRQLRKSPRRHEGQVFVLPAVPADTDALSQLPRRDARAQLIDYAGDFVPGNARILNARQGAIFREHVAMTNAARLNFDS